MLKESLLCVLDVVHEGKDGGNLEQRALSHGLPVVVGGSGGKMKRGRGKMCSWGKKEWLWGNIGWSWEKRVVMGQNRVIVGKNR